MATMLRKRLADFADSQRLDGGFTETAPGGWFASNGLGGPSTANMSHCVSKRSNCSAPIGFQVWPLVAALQLHQIYGNVNGLREFYPSLRAYVELLVRLSSTTEGMMAIQRGLGEWMPVENPEVPLAITGRGFMQMSFDRFAKVASLLEMHADAEKFRCLAKETAEHFNADFLDRNGVYRVNATCTHSTTCTTGFRPFACPACNSTQCQCYSASTQCGQALPLFLGIARNPAMVLEQLHSNVVRNGYAMLVGMQCVEPFFTALSENGLIDVAYKSAMRTEFPGYGFMLANNATTLWEDMRLDTVGHSHNHPMFGAVEGWMLRMLGGIRPHPNASGFDHILIAVRPPRKLRSFSAVYDSVRGRVATAWHWDNTARFHLNVTIPAGSWATVEVPSHGSQDTVVVRTNTQAVQAAARRSVLSSQWQPHLACGEYGCSGVRAVTVGSGTYQFSSSPLKTEDADGYAASS